MTLFRHGSLLLVFGIWAVFSLVACDGGPISPTNDLPPPIKGESFYVPIPGTVEKMEWKFETDPPVGGRYKGETVSIEQWCAASTGLVKSITVRGTLMDEQGNLLPGPTWNIPKAMALNWYVDGRFFGTVCHYPGGGNDKFATNIVVWPHEAVHSIKYEVWLNEPDLYPDRDPDKPWNSVPRYPARPPDYDVVKYVGWEKQRE